MPATDIVPWDAVPPAVADGIERREVPGNGATLRRIAVPAGTRAPRHAHDHEQFLLVLEGRLLLETEAGTATLSPGTVVRFDPDAWHAATFPVDTVLVEVNLRPGA